MDKKIKLLVIGLGVLAAVSLLIAFQLNSNNSKLRAVNATLDQQIAQLNQDNEGLVKKLAASNDNNKSLSSSLNDAQAKAKGIQDELTRLKERLDITSGERDKFLDKIQSLVEDKNKIQTELDKVKAPKAESGQANALVITSGSTDQDAYWAQVLRDKADLELKLEEIKSQLKEITYIADSLSKEKDSAQRDLKTVAQAKEDLERRAAYSEKLANSLSQDLVREKSDKEALRAQLEKVRQDNMDMAARIKDLEDTKTTLYRKIDSVDQDRKSLANKIKDTESTLTQKVGEIVSMKKDLETYDAERKTAVVSGSRTVELAPIVVNNNKETSSTPALTGRVLSINQENKFIVMDLGENQGVRMDDGFGIYRSGEYIGRADVIQLRKDISAADIKDVAQGKDIKVGDVVKAIE